MTTEERQKRMEGLVRRELQLKLDLANTVVQLLDHWQLLAVALLVICSGIYYLGFWVGQSMPR